MQDATAKEALGSLSLEISNEIRSKRRKRGLLGDRKAEIRPVILLWVEKFRQSGAGLPRDRAMETHAANAAWHRKADAEKRKRGLGQYNGSVGAAIAVRQIPLGVGAEKNGDDQFVLEPYD
jgi:hypothetical protein